MNRLLPKVTKDFFSIRLIAFCILLLGFGETYSQAVAITPASGGLSTSPLTGNTTNHAIIGVQLAKDAVAANTVTAITFAMTSNPTGKFTNPRLYESTDATFDGVGTETLVVAGTLNPTNIAFSGSPLTNFDGAGAVADNEFFFVVVDIDPAATGTITPSLANTGVTVSVSSVSGATITGSTFEFLTADFTQNADDATALADEDDVTLLDFTVDSNGTQSLTSTLIFTFNTDVTNILENFDLQVGGVNIAGAETYPLTGGGTILTVTGFTSVDVTNATIFSLLADIKVGASSANDFTVSLTPAGVNVSPGIPEAFGTFSNSVDVTGLEADFTQNADDATALADQNGVKLLDFTVNSNGTQTLNSTLAFTFNTDVTNILENFNLQVGGVNIAGAETYPLTGGGTILTVTGFTSVDVTNATIFSLLADIKVGATSANDFTVSLTPAGVNVSPGIPEAFGTFSNSVDVTGLEADFTQNADGATAFADQNGVELLDFTVNSNGTQTISPNLIFTFNTNVTSILENWDLQVGGVNIPGVEIYTLNGPGTQLTISGFTGVDVTNATNFQLFADIQAGATVSNDFTITLIPGNVSIAPGIVETFGSFSNSIDIVTSQSSDIILNGSTTNSIAYEDSQDNPISDASFAGATSLGDYIIRDGGGSSDGDNKATIVTSIELQVTNAENLRQIVLWDDSDDSEIPGTQQSVSGTGTITIVFTPITPITVPDDGTFEFKTRASFESVVTDNHAIRVSVVSVTAAATGSGFSPVGTWAPTQTAVNTNVIAVVATKFIVNCAPTTQAINAPFTITVQAVDDVFENRDLDYSGKIDLLRGPGTGTFTATQGFTGQSLASGQFVWTNAQFSVSNTYTITANDNAYDPPAPENQVNLENGQRTIEITASSSNITQAADPVLCYGGTASAEVLSNIVITETDPAGISGSAGTYTFSLSLPSGFVFDQTVTTGVSVGGGADLNTPSGYSYPSANVVEFSFNLTATANINTITISGLKARYPHPGTVSPPPTGVLNITRSGGTASVAGVGPGTVLGTISASQTNPAVTFTVAELLGNPEVDPNTTTFNAGSVPVKLVPSSTPAESVFTGSNGGVTYSSPDYRFNPSSLSAGTYPVTLTHTAANGCQSFITRNFEIIISGIAGLNPTYCNNDLPSTNLTVNQAYIDQIMAYTSYPTTWVLDKFVYYDYNVGWVNITAPANDAFDPALFDYQDDYAYWGGQIPVGFSVYNTNALQGVPQGSNYVATYQWVTVRVAPTVNFTLPSDIFVYCGDNVPVTLIGSPANGTNFNEDKFTPSGGQTLSISHSTVGPDEVWTFSPAAVSGVTEAVSQTFNITYQYKDPATNCFNTATRPVTVHARPNPVPSGDITKVQPGALPPSNTTIQLCQGSTSPFSFTASNPSLTAPNQSYTYRWYENSVSPANLKGTSPTFNPSVNTATPGTSNFIVTRERNGCESTTSNLALSVVVVGSPVAPTPNFTDAIRQYCVGGAIDPTHLGVPGTNLKWYNTVSPLPITPIANPNQPTIGELSITTASANTFTYYVTQTEAVNNCEGPSTTVKVNVQALPIVSIAADAPTDPNKICTTGGIVSFSAFDNADAGNSAINGTWSGAGLAGVLNEFPTQGKVDLNPLTLNSGTYTLTYDYDNSAGCSNTGNLVLTILPKVTPNVPSVIVCDDFPAIIVNTSTINPNTSTISTAEWTFGDGQVLPFGVSGSYGLPVDPSIHPGITAGTYQNPTHIYPGVGTFQLEGRLVTSDGCVYNIPQTPVTVSPLPDANFISENVCVDSQTDFTGSADIAVQTFDWDFAKNDDLAPGTATSSGASNVANFTYTITGVDTVSLTVTTAAGCQDIVEKPIFIVPNYTPITATTSYTQDFAVNDGWVTGGRNSSWELGTPAGVNIIGDASTTPATGFAWDTNLIGDNNPDESSWVMSGCFDFTGSVKPVISIDVWSDNQLETDGAVLQYNLTGNIEDDIPLDSDPDGDWELVGAVGAGINWYDAQGISNSPGNQTNTSAGWTGKYGQWKRAIFKLDPVIGQQKVVLRIAFASLQPRGDGFAFDNVFVGERSRIVLLENFTNSSVTGPPPTTHNDNFKNFGNSAELVKIQYHTASPGPDPINALNTQMHNARTAFYGITEAPTIRIDGDFKNGDLASWAQDLYDDRVLTPAILKLNVTAVKDVPTGVVKINTTIENTTNQDIPVANVRIFTTVVEKSITSSSYLGNSGNTEFVFVAKQMLPSPTGVPLIGGNDPALLEAGEIVNAPEIIWEYPEIWDTPDGSAIVVFVQSTNGNNKNVFQAFFLDNPDEPDDVVTGIEDPAYAEKINLFPNPANHILNIELPNGVNRETPVVMFDTYGRSVYQGEFKEGEHRKSVNTSELTGGVFIVQIGTPDGGIARRKIMVVHR